MYKTITYCDICGKPMNCGYEVIKRFVFHIELKNEKDICNECLEQLIAMRKANMMAGRKEE